MSQLFEKFHFHDSHVQLSNAKNRMFLSALDCRTVFFGAHFINVGSLYNWFYSFCESFSA